MSDNTVDSAEMEVPEINEELESLLIQVIEEAQQKMQQGEQVPPFTAAIVGDSLFMESHEGTTEECFASAKDAVRNAAGARAYAFCYDGYLDTDEGQKDAIIAEGGVAGEPRGVAVGMLYETEDEGSIASFDEEIFYIDETENFLIDAAPATVGDSDADNAETEPAEGE